MMIKVMYVILFVIVAIPIHLLSQHSNGPTVGSGDYMGVTGEVGITSFFGDIDEGAANGDVYHNNMAYKLQASRNFKSLFDISGRISLGNMSGQKIRGTNGHTSNLYFKNSFIEYTFDFGINLLAIVTKNYNKKVGVYASIGMGLIDFRVKLYNGAADTLIRAYGYNGESSTTEFVLPIGVRLSYNLSPTSAISVQATSSRVDTDKLDGMTGNDNSDYYNYISFGYTYKFILNKRRPGGISTKKNRK
jgi:hypothetical protein